MNFLMQLQTSGLLLIAAAVLLIGFWNNGPRDKTPESRHLRLTMAVFAVWLFCIAVWRTAHSTASADTYYLAVYWLGTLLPAFLLIYAQGLLPRPLPWPLAYALILVPSLWPLLAASGAIGGMRPLFAERHYFLSGDSWTLLAVFFGVYFAAAIGTLLVARWLDKTRDRISLAVAIIGSTLCLVSVYEILFGAAGLQPDAGLPWVELLAALSGLAVIGLAAVRDRLIVDLRLIVVEAAIFLALVDDLAELSAFPLNPIEFTLRLGLLIMLAVYGVYATRSIIKEIERAHEAEQLQERLTQTVSQVIAGDRQKTKMISLVAHQMRAPLLGIQAYLNMAIGGQFGTAPEEMQRVLELNSDVLTRLLQTVDNFLGVTKIELGHVDLYKTETNLSKLLGNVVRQFQPLAQKKGLAMSLEIMRSVPPITCDQSVIYNVLSNMVDNSIKYTQAGSIKVAAERQGPFVMVTIVDTGVGFKEIDRERLLGQFKRGPAAYALESQGEGLGLYIANQLINAHGGTLIMESPGLGQGSTFGFMLPIEA